MVKFNQENEQLLANNLDNIAAMSGEYKDWRDWLNDEEIDIITDLMARIHGEKLNNPFGDWRFARKVVPVEVVFL